MHYSILTLLLANFLLTGCSGKTAVGTEQTASEPIKQSRENKEVVCFVYHRFGDDRFPTTNVSLPDFEMHLKYLKENNYKVLSFAKAIDYLKNDDPPVKAAVITIDDGYKSFYTNGLPLLEKFDFPATLFINTETVGGGDYMDWKEINNAISRRIELGNHSHSHAYFLNLPESERYQVFEQELRLSQQLIKENTGKTPRTFAYPYGELDLRMKQIVRQFGFDAAAAQNSGVISEKTDLFQCPRFPMSEYYSDPDKFKEKATMKALRILEETPESFIPLPDENTPRLSLTFRKNGLILDQLQCFVQGSGCIKQITSREDGTVQVIIKSSSPISVRRRTLYTVTVPDKEGSWHWYSHLWINPEVK